MSKKPIIVFEGIEGSGKSHHIKVVSRFLDKNNFKFIKIREPGGSLNSEKIRKLILNKKSNFNVKTDLLLYLAARSENINLIKKFYKKKIILIDRFTDSTIAYQHYGMGINLKTIKSLNTFVVGKFKPNLTFLCTVNKKNMFKRLSSRSRTNRYDNFKFKFYDKVRKGFEKLSKNKANYVLLESDKSTQKENLNKIIKAFKKIIN